MNTELRKRLEEAADKEMPEVIRINPVFIPYYRTGFNRCGEWMFKEITARVRKWLDEQGKLDKLDLVEFDMQMSKLWED